MFNWGTYFNLSYYGLVIVIIVVSFILEARYKRENMIVVFGSNMQQCAAASYETNTPMRGVDGIKFYTIHNRPPLFGFDYSTLDIVVLQPWLESGLASMACRESTMREVRRCKAMGARVHEHWT